MDSRIRGNDKIKKSWREAQKKHCFCHSRECGNPGLRLTQSFLTFRVNYENKKFLFPFDSYHSGWLLAFDEC